MVFVVHSATDPYIMSAKRWSYRNLYLELQWTVFIRNGPVLLKKWVEFIDHILVHESILKNIYFCWKFSKWSFLEGWSFVDLIVNIRK